MFVLLFSSFLCLFLVLFFVLVLDREIFRKDSIYEFSFRNMLVLLFLISCIIIIVALYIDKRG